MTDKYFSLDYHENPKLVKISQLVFGVICVAATLYYIISTLKAEQSTLAIWVAIVFLCLFGIYQIMAGLGKTQKYIKIARGRISFKQHSTFPVTGIESSGIEKIEFHPLSIIFYLKRGKRFKFRFGISYPEIIDPVKQEVISFANTNEIPFEVIEDEI